MPRRQAAGAIGCEAVLTLQAGQWLSTVAEERYANPLAYIAIVEATNVQAAIDPSFRKIDDPDLVSQGWKICLPSTGRVEALLLANAFSERSEQLDQFGFAPATALRETEARREPSSSSPQTIHLTLFHLNDVYEVLSSAGGRYGGLARVARLRDQLMSGIITSSKIKFGLTGCAKFMDD